MLVLGESFLKELIQSVPGQGLSLSDLQAGFGICHEPPERAQKTSCALSN